MTSTKKKNLHSVTVSNIVWNQARATGLNISGFLETQLKEYLNIHQGSIPEKQQNKAFLELEKISSMGAPGIIGYLAVERISEEYGIPLIELKNYCKRNNITINY